VNRLQTCNAFLVVSMTTLSFASAVSAGEIIQPFPAEKNAAMQTQWRVVWGIESHVGASEVLFIKEAYFKRGPNEAEIEVLGDCRLAEIFIPYNDGTRLYDISGAKYRLIDLTAKALGPACITKGRLISRQDVARETGPVAVEVRDGHLRWMNISNASRRGQSLVVWSVLDAANYRYVILYEFRDYGLVGFRLGATAHNLHDRNGDDTTHVHIGCWRIGVELGDATSLRVSKVSLLNARNRTRLEVREIKLEDRIRWVPDEFTRLRIENTTLKNGRDPEHPIGYELIPVRMGSARYTGAGEEFTLDDLWVTKATLRELRPKDLDQYERGKPLTNSPLALWHHSPLLHIPRDEDFGPKEKENCNFEGVAITAWAGCDLVPRNFFPKTPLYP
jgi:hypothetical protein